MKRLAYLLVLLLASCSSTSTSTSGELGLGDQSEEDLKADSSSWGAALTCKPIPSLPQLTNPRIFVSIQGLTLRLTDDQGFNKVFPIGPGVIDTKAGSPTLGESLSYQPVLSSGHDFVVTPDGIDPCKTWHTDAETGARSPVFAGLPFLSWSGSYGIHGPIDNFRAPNGGTLRRGFVSHGCLRMEAADVLEVYGRVKGVPRIPVHVQREPERDAQGQRVDLDGKWIGAECQHDSDCAFDKGFCKPNRFSGRSFCSARCTGLCADKAGYPGTFCVADPDDGAQGMCVPKMVAQNADCRPYDHFVAQSAARFKSTVMATVCLPGSPGWIGDHCFSGSDCKNGTICVGATESVAGFCTQACTKYCPDLAGFPPTVCVDDSATGGSYCVRECSPDLNTPECPSHAQCVARSRVGDAASRTHDVCLPQ